MNNTTYIQELTDEELFSIIVSLKDKPQDIKDLMDYDLHLEEMRSRSNPTLPLRRADILRALNNCDLEGSSEEHYLICADQFLDTLGF